MDDTVRGASLSCPAFGAPPRRDPGTASTTSPSHAQSASSPAGKTTPRRVKTTRATTTQRNTHDDVQLREERTMRDGAPALLGNLLNPPLDLIKQHAACEKSLLVNHQLNHLIFIISTGSKSSINDVWSNNRVLPYRVRSYFYSI